MKRRDEVEGKARLEAAVARVRRRALGALEVLERFEWLEGQLEASRSRYTLDELEVGLCGPVTRPAQRQRALVLLGLHPDREGARQLLRAWRPAGADLELERFWRLACARLGLEAPAASRAPQPARQQGGG